MRPPMVDPDHVGSALNPIKKLVSTIIKPADWPRGEQENDPATLEGFAEQYQDIIKTSRSKVHEFLYDNEKLVTSAPKLDQPGGQTKPKARYLDLRDRNFAKPMGYAFRAREYNLLRMVIVWRLYLLGQRELKDLLVEERALREIWVEHETVFLEWENKRWFDLSNSQELADLETRYGTRSFLKKLWEAEIQTIDNMLKNPKVVTANATQLAALMPAQVIKEKIAALHALRPVKTTPATVAAPVSTPAASSIATTQGPSLLWDTLLEIGKGAKGNSLSGKTVPKKSSNLDEIVSLAESVLGNNQGGAGEETGVETGVETGPETDDDIKKEKEKVGVFTDSNPIFGTNPGYSPNPFAGINTKPSGGVNPKPSANATEAASAKAGAKSGTSIKGATDGGDITASIQILENTRRAYDKKLSEILKKNEDLDPMDPGNHATLHRNNIDIMAKQQIIWSLDTEIHNLKRSVNPLAEGNQGKGADYKWPLPDDDVALKNTKKILNKPGVPLGIDSLAVGGMPGEHPGPGNPLVFIGGTAEFGIEPETYEEAVQPAGDNIFGPGNTSGAGAGAGAGATTSNTAAATSNTAAAAPNAGAKTSNVGTKTAGKGSQIPKDWEGRAQRHWTATAGQ
ncbi:hypothetical protein NUW58_g7694 [Xylaria curta]|uniref:Uncharacterized protein n=1 Tax=Xylaria curta TaxID=42375 RepID=A0ACC1NER6_9PEZI|nr:hypothetical protein NUW58_g7694 [Xylaria curta]